MRTSIDTVPRRNGETQGEEHDQSGQGRLCPPSRRGAFPLMPASRAWMAVHNGTRKHRRHRRCGTVFWRTAAMHRMVSPQPTHAPVGACPHVRRRCSPSVLRHLLPGEPRGGSGDGPVHPLWLAAGRTTAMSLSVPFHRPSLVEQRHSAGPGVRFRFCGRHERVIDSVPRLDPQFVECVWFTRCRLRLYTVPSTFAPPCNAMQLRGAAAMPCRKWCLFRLFVGPKLGS